MVSNTESSPQGVPSYVYDAIAESDRIKREVDIRRFALDAALQFMHGSVTTGVKDAPAVLLCANQFHRWLDTGEVPNLADHMESIHAYTWNLIRGLYPESEIQRATGGDK